MSKSKKPDLQLQSIINSHPNPFVLIDEDYNIVAANSAYCSAYGRTSDEVVGRKCHSVSHHFDSPCYKNGEDCPLSTALQTNKVHEVLHIHFDQHNQPEHVRIKGHPIMGADGRRYVGEEVIRLAKPSDLDCEEQQLIGKSQTFRVCLEGLITASKSDANVLLLGESGVGKGLAANYIHNKSARKGRGFVTVDCTVINEAVFESELFGHERGAFAGCVGRRLGLLDEADTGTLFLDEIADIPLSIQGRLLSTIESGKYRRVGGREVLSSDLRIIGSTNRDLSAMVEAGTFRSDLYFRLAGITHRIPPLRERHEDIPALAEALLVRMCNTQTRLCHIREDAREVLMNHDYPGNIRELRNILQKAVSLSSDGIITAAHIELDESPLVPAADKSRPAAREQGQTMQQLEVEHIRELLLEHGGHRRQVADELGISERTLYRKLVKHDMTSVGKDS